MNFQRLLSISVLVLGVLCAAPVAADSPIDKKAALDADFDSLIGEAQQAFGEGNFEAAIEYLVISNRLEPDPRLFLNIARSYEELGECRTSLAYYAAFLHDPPDDPALIERAESALEEGAPRCRDYHDEIGGRLRIDSAPMMASVYIDDELLGVTPTETAGLEPGTYTVRFEHEDFPDQTEEVEIVPREEITIRTSLREEEEEEEEPEEEPDETVAEAPDVEEEEVGFSLNPIALGIAGGGVAALTTGAIFDLVLISGVDDERRQIREGNTDHENPTQRLQELEETRDNYVVGAIVGYVAGGLLVAGGGGWILYDYLTAEEPDDDALGWQVAPEITTDGAGLRMMRRF